MKNIQWIRSEKMFNEVFRDVCFSCYGYKDILKTADLYIKSQRGSGWEVLGAFVLNDKKLNDKPILLIDCEGITPSNNFIINLEEVDGGMSSDNMEFMNFLTSELENKKSSTSNERE